ncbi:retrovirus-related pol polyprotein from transposon TNT 1-94 [Tanacetum coccineum]|uniref:Retrovirus-related pol polyprotein from transposon TNT 1-94 n=1 Tax=Tanacetum coccineum TaxID=301880 RepID=A0ABQ5FKH9_9ASTR
MVLLLVAAVMARRREMWLHLRPSKVVCASSAPNNAYVLIDNNVHTPHEPLVTELAIYKEQVAIYEQRAKFELTEREQRMDDQMRVLIQDRNRMEEKLKQELHSVKLQLNHSIKSQTVVQENVNTLQQTFKQRESQLLNDFSNLRKLKDKLENKLHAQDQSIQTVHMMLKPKRLCDQYSELPIGAQNPFYLKKAKVAQPALYDGNELINVDHDPIDVPSSEEDLELAELTRQKMHEKLNDPVCVEKRIKCIPPNYSKENFLITFTPQTQLTPEQVFWSLDLAKRKAEELKANAPPLPVLPPATVYPPNTPVHLVPRTLPTTSQVNIKHFDGVQKSLVTEVRAMKAVFEEMEAEVDQNAINQKYGEIEHKNLLITNENLIANCIAQDVFYTVTDSALSASRFHDLSTAYNVAMNRVVELEYENSRLLRKSKYDDHDTMIKAFSKLEIAHVNLQLKQQHLKENVNNLKSKSPRDVPEFDVFFELGIRDDQIQSHKNTICKLKAQISELKANKSENNRHLEYKSLDSQNFQLKQTLTDLQNQLEDFKAENANIKLHYQELFNSIKVTRAQTTKKAKSLQNEIENLRAQLKGKMPCVTSDVKTPKVSAFEKYAIDVEPIPLRLKKNREVHLHYIKRLKENVETLREIVEDAKVERPLDTSLASACRYTKHSQELLEYVIGTCPKDFGPRDKQNAYTNLLRKKRVNFVEPCETSTHDTPPQVEYQKINSTNASGIPSTGVKGASAASGSKPRSNTKKDRTLPARSALKQVEAHSRMNKSKEKLENRVDSSISSKRIVVQIVLWYLDLGCSKHMTGDRSRLRNFVKKFIRTVRFGNNHFGAIMGYGDYVIGGSVISRVYYIEGLGHNLFSVGQFCDSDLEVGFRKHTCFVRNLDGVDLIKGSRGKNLYTISVDDMMRSSPICLLSKASKNKGLPRLKFEKYHLCSACQLGRSRKATHKPKMINTIMEVLHTLHMDLYGPMRVQSINGKKYILVIVDDYSRFKWVKFLRSKDETPAFIINLLKQLQVGLNKTIRFVWTDNGTEFINKVLIGYYENVRITHEKTVPRTPQQNGVVERRNRTLVEAARTMLIFSKAPLFMWAEAVATACYTQNQSLIHTLHDKNPYELVHDKKRIFRFFVFLGLSATQQTTVKILVN